MDSWATASLLINIVVLTVVCSGILRKATWVAGAYGRDQPSLGLLLSIYLTFLMASIALLAGPNTTFLSALLAFQVVYKSLSLFLVGSQNPVVLTNVAIALFHSVTLSKL